MEKDQKVYYIRKVVSDSEEKEGFWDFIQPLFINDFPWNKEACNIEAEVRLAYTDTELRVKFVVKESEIKADYFQINDPVYKDSCVEFFLNPDPQNDKRYINFECNAIGVFLLQIGEGQENRCFISEYNEEFFKIKTSVNRENRNNYEKEYWQVEYSIPFTFLEIFYGSLMIKSGYWITGNFYKCGDETKKPHYGCCYPIVNAVPNFHKPEYFKKIIFE